MGNPVGPNDPRGNIMKQAPPVVGLDGPPSSEIADEEVGPNDPRGNLGDAAAAAGSQGE